MLLRFILFLLVVNNSIADTNESVEEPSYIDQTHKILSKKVVDYSHMIDYGMSDVMMDEKSDSIDSFFISDKYIYETADSFIVVKTQADFLSKYNENYSVNLRVHLALIRSKKKLNLFIDNMDDGNIEDIGTNNGEEAPEIGLNYFALKRYGIQPKYYIGFKGIYPFIRARYTRSFKVGAWKIEPVQTFNYSSDYEFKESTNLYFDINPTESTLFRISLYRKTQTHLYGMDYSLSFKYYWDIKKDTAFNISQTFFGNTEYKYLSKESINSQDNDIYSGIHNYITSFSFRQSIWKKWFFYELRPSFNFHKENSYKPNYSLSFLLDFYFGNYPNLRK